MASCSKRDERLPCPQLCTILPHTTFLKSVNFQLSLSLFFKLVSLVYGGRAYETSRSQVTALVEITMEGGRLEAPGTLRDPGNTVWVLLPKML